MTAVIALALVSLILFDVPWVYVGAAAAFWLSPLLGVALGVSLVGWEIIRRRRAGGGTGRDEAAFLRGLAGAVGAGATVRHAVAATNSSIVDDGIRRLCDVGMPMKAVGDLMRPELPVTGRGFSVVTELSETTGASIGNAVRILADQADEVAQLRREQRAAVAQAKLSAVVVGIVPLVAAVGLVVLRGIPEPGGIPTVLPMVIGAAMMSAGSVVVFTFANRAVA